MKNVLLISIVLCTLLIPSLATAYMVPNSPDGYNFDVDLFIGSGWNVVLMPDLDMRESNFEQDSDIKKEDIKVIFVYLPQTNKYYEAYPNNDELMTALESLSDEDKFFLNGVSAWVYSEKSGHLKYSRIDVPKFDEIELLPGWNFLTLLPGMVGKTIDQFSGDCSIEKLAFWDGLPKGWEIASPEILGSEWGDQIIISEGYEANVGFGFLAKVTDSCHLGSSSVINPPPIPN